MLFSLFRNFGLETLLAFALWVPAVLFSLSAHEWAHAYASYKNGDHYAKNMGRMSLNPMKHLDPIGFILLIIVGFGWAKPVPIVPGNFRNVKKGTIIVSLAGVLMNLFLAFFAMNLLFFLNFIVKLPIFLAAEGIYSAINIFLVQFIFTNIVLLIFNLIPIYPLDGFKVIKELFYSWKNRNFFEMLERYGNIILIVVVISGVSGNIISTVGGFLFQSMYDLFALIY